MPIADDRGGLAVVCLGMTTQSPPRGRVRVELSPKRVRAYLGAEPVVDTTRARLVWETPYYPTYYFPVEDVRLDLLEAEDGVSALAEPW